MARIFNQDFRDLLVALVDAKVSSS